MELELTWQISRHLGLLVSDLIQLMEHLKARGMHKHLHSLDIKANKVVTLKSNLMGMMFSVLISAAKWHELGSLLGPRLVAWL